MKRLLFAIIALLSLVNYSGAQNIKIIKLKHQSIVFSPKQFRIAGVVDERKDTESIGIIRYSVLGKKNRVNLLNGAAWSIADYYDRNMEQNPNATPVTIHIKELNLGEKPNGLRDEADLSMTLVFYEGDKKLVEYSGESYVQAGLDVSSYVEGHIRMRLENFIKEFDKFMNENRDPNTGKIAPKVTVDMVRETDDADHIIYSKQRPLGLDDFKGKPDDMSMAAAATYGGIGMKYASETLNGKVSIKVSVNAFFDKSTSWCKATARTPRTLAHEQIHFDIIAVKACELLNMIRNFSFSSDKYDKEMEQLHKQNEKEMEEMEMAYDKETKHGTIAAQQAIWAEKIKQQLAAQACFQ